MGKIYRIDLSNIPTHEERYKILKLFDNGSWEIYEHWVSIDAFHKTLDFFEAFWGYTSIPQLPQLPKSVQITEK